MSSRSWLIQYFFILIMMNNHFWVPIDTSPSFDIKNLLHKWNVDINEIKFQYKISELIATMWQMIHIYTVSSFNRQLIELIYILATVWLTALYKYYYLFFNSSIEWMISTQNFFENGLKLKNRMNCFKEGYFWIKSVWIMIYIHLNLGAKY